MAELLGVKCKVEEVVFITQEDIMAAAIENGWDIENEQEREYAIDEAARQQFKYEVGSGPYDITTRVQGWQEIP